MSEEPIKIYEVHLDVRGIGHSMGSPIRASIHLMLSRMPVWIFKRVVNKLFAEDDGIVKVYRKEKYSPQWKGFAGREFDLNMEDGSKYHAYGQLWDPGVNKDFVKEFGNYWSIGYCTDAAYRKCPVFYSGYINEKRLLEVMKHLGHDQIIFQP